MVQGDLLLPVTEREPTSFIALLWGTKFSPRCCLYVNEAKYFEQTAVFPEEPSGGESLPHPRVKGPCAQVGEGIPLPASLELTGLRCPLPSCHHTGVILLLLCNRSRQRHSDAVPSLCPSCTSCCCSLLPGAAGILSLRTLAGGRQASILYLQALASLSYSRRNSARRSAVAGRTAVFRAVICPLHLFCAPCVTGAALLAVHFQIQDTHGRNTAQLSRGQGDL